MVAIGSFTITWRQDLSHVISIAPRHKAIELLIEVKSMSHSLISSRRVVNSRHLKSVMSELGSGGVHAHWLTPNLSDLASKRRYRTFDWPIEQFLRSKADRRGDLRCSCKLQSVTSRTLFKPLGVIQNLTDTPFEFNIQSIMDGWLVDGVKADEAR